MARIARVVFPGIPHQVTQRGNRRQETFFCDEDYAAYLDLMAEISCVSPELRNRNRPSSNRIS